MMKEAGMFFEETPNNWYQLGSSLLENKVVHELEYIKRDIIPALETVNAALLVGMVADVDEESRRQKRKEKENYWEDVTR